MQRRYPTAAYLSFAIDTTCLIASFVFKQGMKKEVFGVNLSQFKVKTTPSGAIWSTLRTAIFTTRGIKVVER